MSDAASLNHNLAIFNPHDPIYVDLLRRATEYHGSGLGKRSVGFTSVFWAICVCFRLSENVIKCVNGSTRPALQYDILADDPSKWNSEFMAFEY